MIVKRALYVTQKTKPKAARNIMESDTGKLLEGCQSYHGILVKPMEKPVASNEGAPSCPRKRVCALEGMTKGRQCRMKEGGNTRPKKVGTAVGSRLKSTRSVGHVLGIPSTNQTQSLVQSDKYSHDASFTKCAKERPTKCYAYAQPKGPRGEGSPH